MKLRITEKTTLSELKEQFSCSFSGLSLEFTGGVFMPFDFDTPDYDQLVYDLMPEKCSVEIEFNELIKPSVIEDELESLLKLRCEVYRKTGKLWAKVMRTDERNLKEQQRLSEEALIQSLIADALKYYQCS